MQAVRGSAMCCLGDHAVCVVRLMFVCVFFLDKRVVFSSDWLSVGLSTPGCGDACRLMHSNMLRNPLPTDMSVYAHSPVSAIMQWEEVAGAGCVVTPPTPVVPKVLRKSTASQLKEGSQPPMSDMMSQLEEGLDEGEVAPNGATPAAEEAEVAGQAMEVEVQEGDVGEAAVEEEGEAAREEGALEAGEEGEGQEDFSAGRSSGGRGQSLRSRLGRKSSSRAARLLLEMEEEEEGVPGPVPVPKPPSRLFRMVLRSSTVEAEVAVRLYAEYPLRPPLIQVKGLKSLPPATVTAMTAALAKGGTSALKTGMAAPAGKELGGAVVNSIAWMEQQVRGLIISLFSVFSDKIKVFTAHRASTCCVGMCARGAMQSGGMLVPACC